MGWLKFSKKKGTSGHVLGTPVAERRPVAPENHPEALFTSRLSAELKGPGKLVWIRPEIFDFEPDLGQKLGQTKPKIPGTIPTNRHTTIPNDSVPMSACFEDDPKLLNCEIAQPS